MDWDFAIRRKRRELVAVLSTLLAMVAAGAADEGRCAVLRLLRPAESALRRLIFIMAKRLKPASKRAAMARARPDFTTFAAPDPNHVPGFPPGVRSRDGRRVSAEPYNPDEPAAIALDCDLLARHIAAAPP